MQMRVNELVTKEPFSFNVLGITGSTPNMGDLISAPTGDVFEVITHASFYCVTVGSLNTIAFRLNGGAYFQRTTGTIASGDSIVLDHDVVVQSGDTLGVAMFGGNATTDCRLSVSGWRYRY